MLLDKRAVPARDREILRSELGLAPGYRAVLVVEASDALRAAMAQVLRKFPNVRFLEISSESNFQNFLAACDLVVSAGRDGLTEGMAAGKPVVGSSPEIIADGRNGLLVRPDDACGAAWAISRILADPTLADEMGRTGYVMARSMREPVVGRHRAQCEGCRSTRLSAGP
ncbi:MAG: glycosyltransferase [Armatimonadota bacterium]